MSRARGPDVPAKVRHYLMRLAAIGAMLIVAVIGAVAGAIAFGDRSGAPATRSLAAGDVRLTECSVDHGTGWPRAAVEVTNHGTDHASYVVTVAFQNGDATTRYGSIPLNVSDLAPGQKVTARAEALETAPRSFTCAVASVNRE